MTKPSADSGTSAHQPPAGVLRLSDHLHVLPVVHGSGDVAVRVREQLLSHRYDCLAVPLPPSFQEQVLAAVETLPRISAVVQVEPVPTSPFEQAIESSNAEDDPEQSSSPLTPPRDDLDAVDDDEDEPTQATFVPIDPCQPVIAGIRFALVEQMPIAFVDWETDQYEPYSGILPDPYALKRLAVERFAVGVLPALRRPEPGSQQDIRVRKMAFELHRLELEHKQILFLPNLLDWPWIREAYTERRKYPADKIFFSPVNTYRVPEPSLPFFLGELPYLTGLYERARYTLDGDEQISIDGIKQLLIEARDRWSLDQPEDARWVSPKTLRICLQYIRNLTLLERRLTPDLYTLIIAAKQVAGDRFALKVLEVARDYQPGTEVTPGLQPELNMGIDQAQLPDQGIVSMKNRLAGPPVQWRTCELKPEPTKKQSKNWKTRWDPYQQCSWPAEDVRIESFHNHVREQAKALLGSDLARSEKFTTSVKDGLDLRETLRHWHTGDLYVKEVPPARGQLEVVIFLFETPADPNKFSWRTTWLAEHTDESTLGLYATDYRDDMVGPGIGRAKYGGVFFLFPPRYITDIWTDRAIPKAKTLEERLIAAACFHSQHRYVALVSPCPPKAAWRRIARQQGKKLIHLPLKRFSGRLLDQLRTLHVLNGHQVRSYAAQFIRDN